MSAEREPEATGLRGLSQGQITAVVVMMAVLLLIIAGGLVDGTIILAAPLGLALAVVAIVWPLWTFIIFVCMMSIFPIEQDFLGLFIPNWHHGLIPLLLIGAALYNLRHPERRALLPRWSDLLIVAYFIIGLIAIRTEPGANTIKFFINQQVMPAMAYFMVRWLPFDRQAFRTQLRWQLLFVLILSYIMIARVTTGFDPFYHGFTWLGLGGDAIGPMGSISDTVAYMGIFPAFFLYALGTNLSFKPGRPARRLWWFGLVGSMLATMATTERTGLIAIAAALVMALFHRRLFRPVAIMSLALPLLVPLWMLSPLGHKASTRLGTLGDEGAGFERQIYREKAMRYTRSEHWNPWIGTGWGRISSLAKKSIPETEWFYDYNWQQFRPLSEFGERATHCSPITLYAEYGFLGMGTLLLFAGFVSVRLWQIRARAIAEGHQPDDPLILMAVAAWLGVIGNGAFHNTEAVVEVLILMWAFSGLVIGHPQVFVLPRPQKAFPAAAPPTEDHPTSEASTTTG